MPVPLLINYAITLKTEYQQQMNDLLTPFVVRPGNINHFTSALGIGSNQGPGYGGLSDDEFNDLLWESHQLHRKYHDPKNRAGGCSA